DDCIAIKSGRNNDGRRINVPSENIIVRNCVFKDGHGGITVGSECSGGFRNLFAENNKLDSPDLWTALRIKNNASRGGKIENLYFRNITVGKVSRSAIEMDFNYEEGAKGEFTPIVRNFVVENMTAQDCNRVVDLQGLDNAPLYDIVLKNCDFGIVTNANIVKNAKNIKLENVKMNGKVVDKLG
ncbi:MAG TPA: glycosyl hydrolase family 28 protein, partial [Pyrinomonadaceae bacterium]|nr:glycosyl hydrolase family 28 protein [Pyrinomonadaceae bacterium]